MGFNIKKAKGVEAVQDTLGTGGAIPSDLYPLTVKNAYMHESDSGAQALALEVATPEGKVFRQQHYVTTKEGNPYYETQDGKKKYLQGYQIADALAVLVSEGEANIGDLEPEERTISVWDSSKGQEVNKKVPVFVDLLGLEFLGGVLKVIKPKSTKVGDDYVEDPEQTIEINELDKVFSVDGFTTLELMEGDEEPTFHEKWLTRWKGKDKIIKPKKTAAPRAGARAAAGRSKPAASGGAKKSFFKK